MAFTALSLIVLIIRTINSNRVLSRLGQHPGNIHSYSRNQRHWRFRLRAAWPTQQRKKNGRPQNGRPISSLDAGSSNFYLLIFSF